MNAINAGMIDMAHKQDLAVPFDAWADLVLGDKAVAATAAKGSRGLLSLFGSK